MKKLIYFLIFTMSICLNAQQTYYPVTAGNGYGIRFWNSDTYKIHMGNTSEYHFGPVTDYSIKMNMSNMAERGWTWGVAGATPIAALNTLGDFQVARNLFALGKVGIGTSSPTAELDISGNFVFNTDPIGNNHDMILYDNNGTQRVYLAATTGRTQFSLNNINGQEVFDLNTGDFSADNVFIHMPKPDSRIVIAGYGNYKPEHKFVVKDGSALIEGNIITNSAIGIGIESSEIPADYKLAVAGNIISEEVKVKLKSSGWPDFVFNKNYTLPTLLDVENHIKEYGHLQGIPSAEEVAENGVLLGDMNAKLLQKIEELTLYTIEQQKLIEKLSKTLEEQSEIIKEIKNNQ